jgi:hypothetical protein
LGLAPLLVAFPFGRGRRKVIVQRTTPACAIGAGLPRRYGIETSAREEGIGPEADYYIAAWIEARTLSEQPKALVFVLANDGNVYLNGERVDIIVELAA